MMLNKLDKIFMDNPGEMKGWSKRIATTYGVSQEQVEQSRDKVRKLQHSVALIPSTILSLSTTKRRRKLFFDLEVSANICFSWRIGRNIFLSTDDIIRERAIMCACWKWDDETTVHSLEWSNGCDKDLLKQFSKIIDSADEVVTQNGDSFDIKWLRARCIYHRIPVSPKFFSIDTLKMARTQFKFNSNKLDYMGQFLGVGQKMKTTHSLWRDITLLNSKPAMKKMVTYCKKDVILLQKVYNELQPYCPRKKPRLIQTL